MTRSVAAHLMRTESISRADTPEPSARQGRRNDSSQGGVQLLDQDGGLSDRFEACLAHIFAKYIEPPFVAERVEGGLMVSLLSLEFGESNVGMNADTAKKRVSD